MQPLFDRTHAVGVSALGSAVLLRLRVFFFALAERKKENEEVPGCRRL
jgi:hypothetical protein